MKPYRVDLIKSGTEDFKGLTVQLCFESENGHRYADIWIDKMWHCGKHKETVTIYLGGDRVTENGYYAIFEMEDYKHAKQLVYAFLNVV